jgi:hypothetical protein
MNPLQQKHEIRLRGLACCLLDPPCSSDATEAGRSARNCNVALKAQPDSSGFEPY